MKKRKSAFSLLSTLCSILFFRYNTSMLNSALPARPDETRRLVQTLQKVITRARADVHSRLVMMYWEIGQKMADYLSRADNTVSLSRLCRILSPELAIDPRTLQHCHQFFAVYPKPEFSPEITWSQYRCLLTIDSAQKRRYWEKRIIREDLSQRHLLALFKQERLKALPASNPEDRLPDPARGKLYHYRLIHAGTLNRKPRLMIDCGFHNRIDPPKASWTLTNKRIVRCGKLNDGNYQLTLDKATTAAIYTFAARLEHLVDGDTLRVTVDCGFNIWRSQLLRLKGIDTPEMTTIDGERARDYAAKQLVSCPVFVIKTYREDKYKRYLTDLFYLPGESDPAVIASEGRYLNQELLKEGLAKVYL